MYNKPFPFFSWMRTYTKEKGFADFSAGLTVAVVLIPQAMAYALLAGLPPVYGLYAGLVGSVIASLWGSSSQLATGPVAIVSFLVLTSLSPLAPPESAEFISLAIFLALIVGVIQFAMGSFRLGFIMNFVSHAVVVGFSSAAAIIIASTQIPSLLGIKIAQHEFVFETFIEIAKHLPATNLPTLLIGITTIASILLLRKVHKTFPSALLVVVASILGTIWFNLESLGVKVVGSIPSGIPLPTLPTLSFESLTGLIGTGIVISIIGFMEAFAIAKTLAIRTKEKIDVNQELIGQGLANMAVSFFKGYPISGSFSRSAVNSLAGAKTGMAGVFVSLFVLLTLLFLAPSLYHLPKAALAGVVIIAVIGLINIRQFIHLWKTNRTDGIVACVTFASAFIMKPDYALFIGIILSLILFLWKSMSPNIAVMGRNVERNAFANMSEDPAAIACPFITIVRPDRALYFANIENAVRGIEQAIEAHHPKTLIIDAEAVNFIDASAIETLGHFIAEQNEKSLVVLFVNVKTDVRMTLVRSGIDVFTDEKIYFTGKKDVIRYAKGTLPPECCAKCTVRIFQECAR